MSDTSFPANWQIASDFDPNDHMMNLKGRDYLNVQSRMVWFIRDQRALIALGLATQPYRVDSDLVELDRPNGWAHFRATVVDVLGNTSTAYGSESSKDFGDYIEKAATKAMGRALIGLGYGTQYAPEMDEGERVVDAPVERRHTERQKVAQPAPQPRQSAATRTATSTATPAAERAPAASHSDAGRPTAARATQGGVSAWVTTDGYDPTSDLDLKKRAHRIGVNNMADFEAILAYAREHYTPYDRVAVDAAMRVYEGRYEAAQEKVAKTATQQQPRQPQRQGA